MLTEVFENVRKNRPLVHNITNYVTVNDCANMLLACGASPIMADDVEDAEEITVICDALNINIGTLNANTIPAMFAAGKKSRELGHPIVLDPVGAGASRIRTDTALKLLREVEPTLVRGNISEIKALLLGDSKTKGVDAAQADLTGQADIEKTVSLAKNFAFKTGAITAVTGAADIVTDGVSVFIIKNGNPMMADVTGTGCQLSAIGAAFIAANPNARLEAAAAAVCAMGLCGEIAYGRLNDADGNATYRDYIIDAMYRLTAEELERGAKYEKL